MLTKAQQVTEEKLKELEAQCGDDRLWAAGQKFMGRSGRPKQEGDDEALEWQIVFRPPSRDEWLIFKQHGESSNQATKSIAQESLARSCCLLVVGRTGLVPEAFNAEVKKWPGIPESVASNLAKIAGFDTAVAEK